MCRGADSGCKSAVSPGVECAGRVPAPSMGLPKPMKSPLRLYFPKTAEIPNNSLPVLLFRGIVPHDASDKPGIFRRAFRKNGWVGVWTDTIYDYTHFHSNAHEVLGIGEGEVTLRLGGESGRRVRVKAGDMLVIPAGVGHRRLGGDDGLKVVGAYPRGQAHFDMKRSGRRIPKVPLPKTDPFAGAEGALIRFWNERRDQRNS